MPHNGPTVENQSMAKKCTNKPKTGTLCSVLECSNHSDSEHYKVQYSIFLVFRCSEIGTRLHMVVCHLFKPIKTKRLLLVKCYDNKMV